MKRLVYIVLAVFGILSLGFSFAQEKEKVVKKVEVAGNLSVNKDLILSRVKTHSGSALLQSDLDDDLKRLYSMGHFSDVEVDVKDEFDGFIVTFVVVEKAIVKEIVFEGNKAFNEKKLKKQMKLNMGDRINETQLKEDVQAIKDFYKDKGYPNTKVDYSLSVDKEIGHAAIVIHVQEGVRVKVDRVAFVGNKAFREKRLRKVLKTRRPILFFGGNFKEDVFEEDKDRLLDFYRSEGYIDAKIDDVKTSYDASGKKMTLTIYVTEGKQYQVGEVVLEGNTTFPSADIAKLFKMTSGIIFTPDRLKTDVNQIRDYYLSKGYVDATVRPQTVLNEKTQRIDVLYSIEELGISYLDQIKIRGNTKTKDIVIRRELAVKPGEVFNGVKVRRSQERLMNLGYFKTVLMDIEPTDRPEKKNLLVDVEETKTGEIGFGVGFSSIDNLIGFVEMTQKNFDWKNFPTFTGDGQKLRIRAQVGTKRQDYTLSWTEPWLFDRPISFGMDLYRRDSRFLSDVYDERRTGGDLRLGKKIVEFVRADLTYKLEEDEIRHVSDSASDAIKQEAGTFDVSSMEFSLTRDTRNSPLSATQGMRNSISLEVAGGPFGFDRDFTKYTTRNSLYIPLPLDLVLRLSGQAGLVDNFGDSDRVPLFERFFLGGANTIRGFKFRDVGPKDEEGEPIGGKSMITGSAELTYPIFEKLRGAVFYDTGNVYEDYADFDLGDLRTGVGVGLRLDLPIGPIRLDYGWPIDRDEFQDSDGRFDFNIGYSF
ncbi:MAG: outer membrane protein assembly factor BamA [Chlamydiae bacterium]|nr:outer membrane protein assembly factor BamA [Chlamydiota bacterium]MBI3277549.1 outer membrane protein assembly factor BamA [Chlamydiota bacterium]